MHPTPAISVLTTVLKTSEKKWESTDTPVLGYKAFSFTWSMYGTKDDHHVVCQFRTTRTTKIHVDARVETHGYYTLVVAKNNCFTAVLLDQKYLTKKHITNTTTRLY